MNSGKKVFSRLFHCRFSRHANTRAPLFVVPLLLENDFSSFRFVEIVREALQDKGQVEVGREEQGEGKTHGEEQSEKQKNCPSINISS